MLKTILFLIMVTITSLSYAETSLPMDKFGKFPILHEGRLKPLDSFARFEILQFAKREQPNDVQPLEWLADTIFDPADAVTQKIFLVENAENRHKLGLEERKNPFYSYIELSSGLEKTSAEVMALVRSNDKKIPDSQKELLSIHENALQYKQLLRSFSSVLPLNISLPDELRNKAGLSKDDNVTFTSLQKINPDIEEKIRKIIKRKGDNPALYTQAEQDMVALGWQIKIISEASVGNTLLRVIPTTKNGDFASPWELLNDGKGGALSTRHLDVWILLAEAWQKQDQKLWAIAIDKLEGQFLYDPPATYDGGRIFLETIYNRLSPFQISLALFSFSFIAACLSFVNGHRAIYQLAYVGLGLAMILQALGLGMRVYLMERPPVGTLYESMLFVGLIAPSIGLFAERYFKNGIGIFSGAVSGVMVGLLALSMAGEGDNMKVLGAVLNTRFWLATHVLCITIGYGWCILTSVLAHFALAGKAFGRMSKDVYQQLTKTITTHGIFSLLFTTVGTILGGIWADQSWGRFWGWDPKENGALLIVLWLIWFIHGKIAGQISQLIWMGGMALLSVIVAVAWVGVNLLGVGLHSYGFIEGVFWGLGVFAILEVMIVAMLIKFISDKERIVHAH